MSSRSVLILDADHNSGKALQELVAQCNYDSIVEQTVSAAVNSANRISPSVIIAGNSSAANESFDLLRQLRTQQPDIPIVLLSDSGSIELAIRAIQEEGAYHYFEKPVDVKKLQLVLDRAAEFGEARRENTLLRRQLQQQGIFGELVGSSAPMREIYSVIEQVSPSSASVLI